MCTIDCGAEFIVSHLFVRELNKFCSTALYILVNKFTLHRVTYLIYVTYGSYLHDLCKIHFLPSDKMKKIETDFSCTKFLDYRNILVKNLI